MLDWDRSELSQKLIQKVVQSKNISFIINCKYELCELNSCESLKTNWTVVHSKDIKIIQYVVHSKNIILFFFIRGTIDSIRICQKVI